jgi:hypothetical protein
MLGDGVELDPSAVADQLFATELASLFGGISQLQAAAAQREQVRAEYWMCMLFRPCRPHLKSVKLGLSQPDAQDLHLCCL